MASSQPASTFPQSYLDEYIGYRLKGTAIAFIVLDTCFCSLRIWARKFNKIPLGWDDLMVFLGWLFCMGVAIVSLRKLSLPSNLLYQRLVS